MKSKEDKDIIYDNLLNEIKLKKLVNKLVNMNISKEDSKNPFDIKKVWKNQMEKEEKELIKMIYMIVTHFEKNPISKIYHFEKFKMFKKIEKYIKKIIKIYEKNFRNGKEIFEIVIFEVVIFEMEKNRFICLIKDYLIHF